MIKSFLIFYWLIPLSFTRTILCKLRMNIQSNGVSHVVCCGFKVLETYYSLNRQKIHTEHRNVYVHWIWICNIIWKHKSSSFIYILYFVGPTHWHQITTDWRFCGRSTQSPVNIGTTSSIYRPDLKAFPLRFRNLCLRIPARIRNNGI